MSDRPLHVLCAPDKLRGALHAAAAAAALAEGVREAGGVAWELPIADGGEGTLDALLAGAGGAGSAGSASGVGAAGDGAPRVHTLTVPDALGRPRTARLGALGEGTFVVEAAEAVPLHALAERERDVERGSSAGVGELVRAALDRGARRILIALGGSATVDGGAGALRALGARCPHDGAGLLADPRADLAQVDPRLRATRIELLLDVDAPLTGPDGAAHRFGPQKGASATQVRAFDAALARWAPALGVDPATPGAGAAGGLGAAFMALGAHPEPGAPAILDLLGFDRLLADSDLCLTAEGSVDASTLQGKAVAAVVERCAAAGTPVHVHGGRVEPGAAAELRRRGAASVEPLGPPDRPLSEAFAAAADELAAAARAVVRRG